MTDAASNGFGNFTPINDAGRWACRSFPLDAVLYAQLTGNAMMDKSRPFE